MHEIEECEGFTGLDIPGSCPHGPKEPRKKFVHEEPELVRRDKSNAGSGEIGQRLVSVRCERRRQDLNLEFLAEGGFQDRCSTGLSDVGKCGATLAGRVAYRDDSRASWPKPFIESMQVVLDFKVGVESRWQDASVNSDVRWPWDHSSMLQ